MSAHSLSPVAVVKYSRNYLHDLIRHLTGWDQRSEVSDKVQLTYLCSYLEINHINAQTIVLETEYVDRHYLEDYSEYYARCFPSHPRKCARLHFFSHTFTEPDFISALESNDADFINKLSEQYLGYVVIRPIPHTFLAKVCLIRYSELVDSENCKLIAIPNEISLFGIKLTVDAAPFLEQDKVVSVCATSALWMFFNSSGHKIHGDLPSPSAITKSATGIKFDGARTFPNTGLSPTQVARSLKHFGFEPMIFNVPNDYLDFKEVLFGYIKNDIPVLIAGSIYQKRKADGVVKHVGDHLVCALGYRLVEQTQAQTGGMLLASHKIEKIYVHDDRYGPYLRVSLPPERFEFTAKDGQQIMLEGLELSIGQLDITEYFVPDLVVVGVYHKIRLTYFDIRKMSESFFLYLRESKSRIDKVLSMPTTSIEDCLHLTNVGENLKQFLNATFEIALTSNTNVKKDVLESKAFFTFNGSLGKSSCLLQSMPKYIWRCRLISNEAIPSAGGIIADILFDATEVAQGQVIVGYITYAKTAENMWKYVERSICNNLWAAFPFSPDIKLGISGFLKFFQKNRKQLYLNTLYGLPGLPRRDLKPGEADTQNNICIRKDIQTIRSSDSDSLKKLRTDIKHIWVINEYGDLVIGEDIEDKLNNANNQGHPTLVDGRPARLGGELIYSSQKNCWYANLKSGTYSSHLPLGSEIRFRYLSNVVNSNLSGLNVRIEEDEFPKDANTASFR